MSKCSGWWLAFPYQIHYNDGKPPKKGQHFWIGNYYNLHRHACLWYRFLLKLRYPNSNTENPTTCDVSICSPLFVHIRAISCPYGTYMGSLPDFWRDPSGKGTKNRKNIAVDFDDVPTEHFEEPWCTQLRKYWWYFTCCPEKRPVYSEDIHHLWFFGSWTFNQTHTVSPMKKMHSMETHFFFKWVNFGIHQQNMGWSMVGI